MKWLGPSLPWLLAAGLILMLAWRLGRAPEWLGAVGTATAFSTLILRVTLSTTQLLRYARNR